MGTVDERIRALRQRRLVVFGYGVDAVTAAVAVTVLLALLARLLFLGARVAHWDEARVGYWILDYIRTGNYEYRAIIHGPFYHHVNRAVFALFGAGDASMRLVVALLGGFVPATALLFRGRLRDAEVVALALFLAANPLLLYYSRFMRGDPVVAFFMFAAFGLFVRTVDTGSRGSFLAGVLAVSLAFTAKENALVYVVTWAGATALLLDHRLFRAGDREQDWTRLLRWHVRRAVAAVRSWALVIAAGVAEFLLVIVYFYAPRSGTDGELGLGQAFSDPSLFPAVIEEATVGTWTEFYGTWVGGGHQDHAYLPFLGDFVETMAAGAIVVSLFAVVGVLVDRYDPDGPRDVVAFAFYWGFVSVLGYPIITDIKAPWAPIHAVVPLTIPAAVGVALIYRWGREALAGDDAVSVGLAALLLVLSAGVVAGTAADTVYLQPQSSENDLVQYAQPGDDIRTEIRTMAVAAAGNSGTDVVLYGDFFVDGDEGVPREPACAKWFNALPLPWYFSLHDVDVACAENETQLRAMISEDPPMVITRQSDLDTVRQYAGDYEESTYILRTYGTETSFLTHPDWAGAGNESRRAYRRSTG